MSSRDYIIYQPHAEPITLPAGTGVDEIAFAGTLMGSTALTPPRFMYRTTLVADDPGRSRVSTQSRIARFALLNTHANYAGVIAALNVHSTEVSPLNSAYTVVTCDLPPSRTGALAPIDRGQYGVGVFLDEYIDYQDYQERGLPLLNRMSETPYPELLGVRYVRPSMSGTRDGLTYGTAFNTHRDNNINGGSSNTHQRKYKYYLCGGVHRFKGTSGAIYSANPAPFVFAAASGTDRIEYACDVPLAPGVLLGTWTDDSTNTFFGAVKLLSWVSLGGGRWVQGDFQRTRSGCEIFQDSLMIIGGLDPRASLTTIKEKNFLVRKASVAALVPGAFYENCNGKEDWLAVFREASGVFTDITAAVASSAAEGTVAYPSGMANGDRLWFISSNPFNAVHANLGSSSGASGATIDLKYSNGVGSLGTISTIAGGLNKLKGGTGSLDYSDTWSPPQDHVQDTINGVTGYAVCYEKSAGSVTADVTIVQGKHSAPALYVQMPDNADPTNLEICTRWDGGGSYIMACGSTPYIRLSNFRYIGASGSGGDFTSCDAIEFLSGQFAFVGSLLMSTSRTRYKFGRAPYGRNCFDHSDRTDYDGRMADATHPICQKLLAKGADAGYMSLMHRNTDWYGLSNGPYLNLAGLTEKFWIDGMYARGTCELITNSVGTIISYSAADGHTLAARGSYSGYTVKGLVMIGVGRACDYYPSATGNNTAPAAGSGSDCNNMLMDHSIIMEYNLRDDTFGNLPCEGIFNDGDSDAIGTYDDGTGSRKNNKYTFCGMYKINPPDTYFPSGGVSSDGIAYSALNPEQELLENCVFDTVNWIVERWTKVEGSVSKVLRVEGGVATDLTALVLNKSGNTAQELLTATMSVGDYLLIGMTQNNFNRFSLNLTQAGAGGFTISVKEWTGASYDAVSGLSDASSSLTLTGLRAISWTRNANMAPKVEFGSASMYFVKITLESGSIATPPKADIIKGRRFGGHVKFRNCDFYNVINGFDKQHGALGSDSSGLDIDSSNRYFLRPGETIASSLLFDGRSKTQAAWVAAQKSIANTDMWLPEDRSLTVIEA